MANNLITDWTLKVEPSVLDDQAQAVRTANNELKDCFNRMKNLMLQTENFWKGEAAEAHRNRYSKHQTAIDEIVARYSEHVADLEQMAQKYRDSEKKAEAQVAAIAMPTF